MRAMSIPKISCGLSAVSSQTAKTFFSQCHQRENKKRHISIILRYAHCDITPIPMKCNCISFHFNSFDCFMLQNRICRNVLKKKWKRNEKLLCSRFAGVEIQFNFVTHPNREHFILIGVSHKITNELIYLHG